MEWKTVRCKGLDWLVSSCGKLRSPAHITTFTRTRNGKTQTFSVAFPERPITPWVNNSGYFEATMRHDGKREKALLHRLVGMAWVPGYSPELTINHIDGNKLNNDPSNLEWVSLARNTQHQWESGLVDLRGDAHPSKKLSSKQVVYIRRLLAQGISAHSLAIVAGVSPASIAFIRDGRRWPTVTAGRPVVVNS